MALLLEPPLVAIKTFLALVKTLGNYTYGSILKLNEIYNLINNMALRGIEPRSYLRQRYVLPLDYKAFRFTSISNLKMFKKFV